MKTSELISELQKQLIDLGDVQVTIRVDGFGGYGAYTVSSLNASSIYSGELCEDEEPSLEEIKEFFPEWEGTAEEFFDADLEMPTLAIKTGRTIYTT